MNFCDRCGQETSSKPNPDFRNPATGEDAILCGVCTSAGYAGVNRAIKAKQHERIFGEDSVFYQEAQRRDYPELMRHEIKALENELQQQEAAHNAQQEEEGLR